MQKVINVLAVLSFVGTAGIVGGGAGQGSTGIFTLGAATSNSLGGIKVGSNLSVDSSGTLDAVMNLNNESISEPISS